MLPGRWTAAAQDVPALADDAPPPTDPLSARAVEIASERIWWSEAMTAQMQRLLSEQTHQLRSYLAAEAQKQRTMMMADVQKLLAAQTPRLGDAHDEQSPQEQKAQEAPRTGGAPQGHLEKLLGQEMRERRSGEEVLRRMMEQHGMKLQEIREQPAGEAGLREMLEQQGVALQDLSAALAAFRLEMMSPPDGGEDALSVPSTPMVPDGDANPVLRPQLSPAEQSTPSTTLGLTGMLDSPSDALHRRRWKKLSQSRRFVLLTSALIVANSIYLGFEANTAMTSSDFTSTHNLGYRITNACFAFAFAVELAIRWYSDGSAFLCQPRNPDFLWNWLDLVIIAATVLEELLRIFAIRLITFGFLRLTRLLRVSRMMRAFKVVREFKELKIMINGLMNCTRPLFWAGLLILGLTYMMAIIMAQIFTDYLRSDQDADREESQRTREYMENNFSNLWDSMYSLFEALAGGRDWGEVARPFRHISWVLACCLVVYIIIGVFCLLNLLTAVFLEAAQRVDDLQELVYAKKDWVNEARDFFHHAVMELRTSSWSAEPEQITRDKFITLLKAKQNVKFLEENGVDLCFMTDIHLGELFDIMDENNSGSLDVEEFVGSLYSLKGPARALDLRLEHNRTIRQLSTMQDSMNDLAPSESRRETRRVTERARTVSKQSTAGVNEPVD